MKQICELVEHFLYYNHDISEAPEPLRALAVRCCFPNENVQRGWSLMRINLTQKRENEIKHVHTFKTFRVKGSFFVGFPDNERILCSARISSVAKTRVIRWLQRIDLSSGRGDRRQKWKPIEKDTNEWPATFPGCRISRVKFSVLHFRLFFLIFDSKGKKVLKISRSIRPAFISILEQRQEGNSKSSQAFSFWPFKHTQNHWQRFGIYFSRAGCCSVKATCCAAPIPAIEGKHSVWITAFSHFRIAL